MSAQTDYTIFRHGLKHVRVNGELLLAYDDLAKYLGRVRNVRKIYCALGKRRMAFVSVANALSMIELSPLRLAEKDALLSKLCAWTAELNQDNVMLKMTQWSLVTLHVFYFLLVMYEVWKKLYG